MVGSWRGDVCVSADGFDNTYFIRHDLSEMPREKLPITMLTDSESLFRDITSSSSITSEKRPMADCAQRSSHIRMGTSLM